MPPVPTALGTLRISSDRSSDFRQSCNRYGCDVTLTAAQIIDHVNASLTRINPDHESVVVPAAEVVF